MHLAVGMATGLTLIQTIGAYLRYLPFEAGLPEKERARLFKYILFWMPVAFLIDTIYFWHAGVDVETYKRVHYFGWIPFFSLSLVVIRNEGMRHTFVAGMQTLWFMLLQTMAGTLILTLLPPHYGMGVNRVAIQSALYIVFFLLLLPIEQRIFRNLLPSYLFSGSKLAGWSFAVLPWGLCAAPLITLIERPLMYTWTDRFSRFFLIFWGFMLYQYALYAGRRSAKFQSEQHNNEILRQQLHALESQALLLESRAEDVRRMRHDLRHYNRLLASLLDAGDTAMARQVVEAQEKDLQAEPIAYYCKSPIVNAALTVYVQMALKEGIRVSCGVDIDAAESDRESESDLAILLSNVIENAVNASRKQPEASREIVVSLSCDGERYALAVKNRFDAPLPLGGDGLPMPAESGHGTGMVSLKNFAEKYGAEKFFKQKDGWVQLLMYWNGKRK